ncbi:conserved hypothetical protein [Verticillium alfalfae VaMs.102]|uniref:DUF202 domain-containing protein n=2 Tax=Verticillium TaxID=1036719 RepID=C9STL2_VERA1|nr:conserved hypothetical protein [Verticillium alfalfae VaMs.102]EEY22173.1 conserved hypothetical protein [Verticillium alfalfae VaMs.102]
MDVTLDDEDLTPSPVCLPLAAPIHISHLRPEHRHSSFWTWPFYAPLLFENETSDARDHCANERTFLSYLRLSVYMAIVSVAIVLSFHLKTQPSEFELRMAKPLGATFWGLSVCCLFLGLGNYISTMNKYSRKAAIVQTGWKTQLLLSVVAMAIIGTCVVLLVIAKVSTDTDTG